MSATRPRRSALYMPASNPRALEKARGLPADVLILDLEDAVAPERKEEARRAVCEALAAGGYGPREVLVRVNALDTPWGAADLVAMAGAGADGIVLPKVSAPVDVHEAVRRLQEAGAAEATALWIMAETARCILGIEAIAGSHPWLAGILMGTSDLARECRIRHTPDRLGFLSALSTCVLAARAHGLAVLDGVHLDLDDDEGLARSCTQGRDLGFDGKTIIHPKQLVAANAAFAPSAEALERAARILSAWRETAAAGKAVVVVDGKLVENLHVQEAERDLALAERIKAMGW